MNSLKRSIPLGVVLIALAGPVLGKEADGAEKRPRMAPRKVLTQFDANKDGKIEGPEAEKLRKSFDGDLRKQLEPFDKDRNGRLDDAEISAIKVRADSRSGGIPRPKNPKSVKPPGADAPVK